MAGRGQLEPSGFGERLAKLRADARLTQAELGEKSELHANTIARLERGLNEPAWPVVLKLATALGVNCTAFTGAAGATGEAPARGRGRPRKADAVQPAAAKKGKKS